MPPPSAAAEPPCAPPRWLPSQVVHAHAPKKGGERLVGWVALAAEACGEHHLQLRTPPLPQSAAEARAATAEEVCSPMRGVRHPVPLSCTSALASAPLIRSRPRPCPSHSQGRLLDCWLHCELSSAITGSLAQLSRPGAESASAPPALRKRQSIAFDPTKSSPAAPRADYIAPITPGLPPPPGAAAATPAPPSPAAASTPVAAATPPPPPPASTPPTTASGAAETASRKV